MFYDVEQNTDEWFNLRLGVPTASNFSKLMANVIKKDGVNVNCAFGEPAKEYAEVKAMEILRGVRHEPNITNKHIERGHEEEPVARAMYEETTFSTVTNGGIWVSDGSGASSDGLVDDDGMVEIKSVIQKNQWKRIKLGGADPAYKWQYQGNLWKYERKWCDFVQICTEFPEGHQLYIFRVERDEEMIELLKQRVKLFNKLVDSNIKTYNNFINGK